MLSRAERGARGEKGKQCLRQASFCHPCHAPLPAHSSIILERGEAPGYKHHLAELPSPLSPEWMLRMGKPPFMVLATVDVCDLRVGYCPRCNWDRNLKRFHPC